MKFRLQWPVYYCSLWICIGCGCSSLISSDAQPVFMQNTKYTNVGQMEAERDRMQCMHSADENVIQEGMALSVLKGAALGALVGSMTGAISGAILDDQGENVAAGAAVGTVVGSLQSFIDSRARPPNYERFVEQCLHQKGYQVIGWESP